MFIVVWLFAMAAVAQTPTSATQNGAPAGQQLTPAAAQSPTAAQPQNTATSTETIGSHCGRVTSGIEHGELLAHVCDFALTLFDSIPNYLCREEIVSTSRQAFSGLYSTRISMELRVENGHDTYRDVKVNGQPIKGEVARFAPQSSSNEFGGLLPDLFRPGSGIEFAFAKETRQHDRATLIFKFTAPRSEGKSLWAITVRNTQMFPAYRGELWVDAERGTATHVAMEATDLGSHSALTSNRSQMDYSEVQLGDGTSFLLPVHMTLENCSSVQRCIRNDVTYSNCHKFRADSRIIPTP